MAASDSGGSDTLSMATNEACQRMLAKNGSMFPDPEKVIFSGKAVKINRKKKTQPRALLITDRAVYNLMPTDYSKMRRRIDIEIIQSITLSTTSDEFVFHIPSEYDYRFISKDKEAIATITAQVYQNRSGTKLPISRIDQSSLLSICIDKDISSREQRLRRYREMLAAEAGDSDEETNFASADVYGYGSTSKKSLASPQDFKFLKVIGRGSFGKVMLVRHKTTEKVYAMKILKKKSIVERNQVEHTNAERTILQSLKHPFCMSMEFAFQTEAKLYLVLDYYRGGELFFHLKKQKRFTLVQSRFIVAEIGMALGHLHSLGIVYRDLKPENILLDHSGHACLTDFGLSKDLGGDLYSYTFCGTPEYLAPEIVMNTGHTKAVDWWSLGVLLYELTIGIPPFYSTNVNEMYRKIQTHPLVFPTSVKGQTLQFKSLASELLERNPKRRLGAGVDDFEEIMRHPFFIDMDFDKLYAKELDAPFKPQVKGGDDDTSLFDRQFTSEPVVDSHVTKSIISEDQQFPDFNYTRADDSE